jgi:hypothetical protein
MMSLCSVSPRPAVMMSSLSPEISGLSVPIESMDESAKLANTQRDLASVGTDLVTVNLLVK